jgi:L-threonylcarbamoyladenylate synthase
MPMTRLDVNGTVAALSAGGVVAVPTDTVYGVGARVADAAAVQQLFAVKSRPRDVALPVLVAAVSDVIDLGLDWTDTAAALATRYWPGALTIVVGAPVELARRVGAEHSVGVRQPQQELLLEVIRRCGPLAVTSANEHGQPPCTSAEEILAASWGAPVAGVLDGGICRGTVSSVVELRGRHWRMRRHGAVGVAELTELLGPEATSFDN